MSYESIGQRQCGWDVITYEPRLWTPSEFNGRFENRHSLLFFTFCRRLSIMHIVYGASPCGFGRGEAP